MRKGCAQLVHAAFGYARETLRTVALEGERGV